MAEEKIIEKYLKKQVEYLGGITFKFVSPGRRGVPDRILIVPGVGVLFVELKAKAGRLSIHQRRCFSDISDAGGDVIVLNSKSEVDEFLADLVGMDDCTCEMCVERRNKRGMH